MLRLLVPWDQVFQDQYPEASQLVNIICSLFGCHNHCVDPNAVPHRFQEDANVTVTFLGDGTTMAKITFEVYLSSSYDIR